MEKAVSNLICQIVGFTRTKSYWRKLRFKLTMVSPAIKITISPNPVVITDLNSILNIDAREWSEQNSILEIFSPIKTKCLDDY